MAASKLLMTLGLSTAALALVLIGAGVAGPRVTGVNGIGETPEVNAILAPLSGDEAGAIVAQADSGGSAVQGLTVEQIELQKLRHRVAELENFMNNPVLAPASDLKPRDIRTTVIEKALDSATVMEFPGNPLLDVLDYLATVHEIPILPDHETLAETGIDPRDQEVRLVVSGITMRNALDLLLENVGGQQLDYVIQNQVLRVTTREKADQTLETRVYSLRPLENSGFDSYSVANVIRKTIEPASWAHIEIVPEPTGEGMEFMMGMGGYGGGADMSAYSGAGGMGSGMMGPSGLGAMQIDRKKSTGLGTIEALPGCLVITQSQRVHRGVADLLGQLRAQAEEGASGGAGFGTGGGPAGMGGAGIGSPFGTVDPVGGATAPPGGSSGAARGAGLGAGAAGYDGGRPIPDYQDPTGGAGPPRVGSSPGGLGPNAGTPSDGQ